MFSIARMIGSNLRHTGPLIRAYRALSRQPETPCAVERHRIGLGISPTAESFDRLIEAVEEIGVHSLLVRVPSWNPESVLGLIRQFTELKNMGYGFIFSLLQDRRTALTPASWSQFVHETAARLAHLEPTFQLGQAINRKKWGLWHPDEYLRLMEATAAVRDEFPSCRWIGPPIIDFEYHYTLYYLFSQRPFDFDGIASLLYVDRRGSPDSLQYRHFDLHRKILLLRAILAASPHPDVPLYLTEFNWPLKGSGEHSPAGPGVETDDERQATYMTIYYLTALASRGVAGVYWWQLVATGYGLCDQDERWTRRLSFEALRVLVRRAAGSTVARLASQPNGIRGFILRNGDTVGLMLYADSGPVRLTCARPPDEAHDLVGRPLCVSSGTVQVGSWPAYLLFSRDEPDTVLEACGLSMKH